jgi:hypothetical protein
LMGIWTWSLIVSVVLWEFRQMQAVMLILFCVLCDLLIHMRRKEVISPSAMVYLAVAVLLLCSDAWWMISEWLAERSFAYADYYIEHNLNNAPGLSSLILTAQGFTGVMLRCVYGIISPIPFLGMRFEEQYQGSGSLINYAFLPFFGLGLLVIVRRKIALHWLLAFVLFYSMTLFTFVFRHSVVFFPYAALITAVGYAEYRPYRTVIWGTVAAGGVSVAVLYFLLKYGI